jgi:hypothetical protein
MSIKRRSLSRILDRFHKKQKKNILMRRFFSENCCFFRSISIGMICAGGPRHLPTGAGERERERERERKRKRERERENGARANSVRQKNGQMVLLKNWWIQTFPTSKLQALDQKFKGNNVRITILGDFCQL